MGVESIVVAGDDAWLKAYADGDKRRFGLGILDAIARGLDIEALRPPSHPGGGEAKRIEARRLGELDAQGVRVPRVLGEGASTLLLSNLGDTFAAQLRAAAGDVARIDALTSAVIDAIADAHARGAYLGQPMPRNITLDDSGRVGFIDFEEDPLEVMSLPQAQARDWLLFAFGMARYYDGRTDVLADLLSRAMQREPEVAAHAGRVGRLEGFAQRIRWLGRSARRVAHSILVVRAATLLPGLLVAAVLWDWIEDGEIELLRMLF
ncbi:serine/threonine protein phosphatase [Luteimonas sp. 3794]|uniref:serine/threonine protein phosphatase n=1 Tax=Luteimonas sp. 3794 TaxID=2817730 RepID=UPI00285AB5E1|nr:serine/threonine protein phosphatase [Luteimonas sp. 3794]MDR6992414.1 tRNA A-37 threonylcarbamoyl transferase component Bud32 [Luteimonas sp. 3794]